MFVQAQAQLTGIIPFTEVRGRVGRLIHYSPTAQGAFARRIRKLSSVSHFHPHQMRHTFASRLAQEGTPILKIKELLGHSSITVTMRYAHLAESNLRGAVFALDRKPALGSTHMSTHAVKNRGESGGGGRRPLQPTGTEGKVVDQKGVEPSTSTMRVWRSPN